MKDHLALPANPLAQEVFCAGLDRLDAGEQITEVQRQVMQEWFDIARRRITDLQIKLHDEGLSEDEKAEAFAIARYIRLWDARSFDRR